VTGTNVFFTEPTYFLFAVGVNGSRVETVDITAEDEFSNQVAVADASRLLYKFIN